MSGPAAENFISINGFFIDCSIRENHSFDSDVTDFPVESGANITDNIRPLPVSVEIEGLVSNTPIGQMANKRYDVGVPTDTAYDLFMKIREDRKPVTIITSLRTYDNMAMKSLSIPRGDHEDGMKFTATFQQISTVENKRTIRVSVPIASNGGKGGGKTVTKSPEPSNVQVILFDRFHQAWLDPDFQKWRVLAVLKRDTSQGFYADTGNKLHLWRGYFLDVQDKDVRAKQLKGPGIAKDATGGNNFERQVIMVPASGCIMHGFTIKSTSQSRELKAWE